jgi:hypothetical protein
VVSVHSAVVVVLAVADSAAGSVDSAAEVPAVAVEGRGGDGSSIVHRPRLEGL